MEKKIIPIIACDFGYGYVKIYDGKNFITFRSLVSVGRKIRFVSGLATLTDLNCLSVKVGDDQYFVGDLAERQGGDVLQVLDKDKVLHKSTEILIKTGLGLLAGNYTEVAVVTGLPVSYYNDEQKNAMSEILRQKHTITYDKSLLGKKDEVVDFTVHFTSIVPQPIGTLWDLVLDEKGDLIDKTLASKNIGLVDIGFGTTDFAVSRCLEYIDRSSKSIPTAIHSVCSLVSQYLSDQIGEEVQIYEIEKAMLSKKISIRGSTYDLTPFINKAVDVIFMDIKTVLDALWDRERQLDAYVITGGGANLFGQSFKNAFGKKANVIVPSMPSSSNVKGFYKYMHRKMYRGNQ